MSKLLLFVSANIIFLFISRPSFASPQDKAPDSPQEQPTWPVKPPGEDMSVSTPPLLAEPPLPLDPHYYPYQQQLTFRAGASGQFPANNFEDSVIGFQYLFPKFLAPKLEAGADLHNGGNGHIHAGLRWMYWERSYFRPSYKLSLDHLVVSSQGLATVAHFDNYSVRATGTLEYVVWNPYSLRLEAELLANFNGVISELTLGLSRGW